MSLAKTCLRWGNTFIAMQSGLVFSCLPNCKPHGCPAHERPQKKRLEDSRTLNSSQLHPANSTRGFPVCSQPFCLRFFLQVLLSVETQVIKSCGRDYRSSQVWPKDPPISAAMAQTEAKTTCTRRRRQFLSNGQNRQQQQQY